VFVLGMCSDKSSRNQLRELREDFFADNVYLYFINANKIQSLLSNMYVIPVALDTKVHFFGIHFLQNIN
jgi:hypothetical protein